MLSVQTHPLRRRFISFLRTSKVSIKLLVLSAVICGVPLALNTSVDSKGPGRAEVTVRAAGRGGPYLNFKDGRNSDVEYRGQQQLVDALRSGQAQARSLGSADLDDNGTPDVLAGYAYQGFGVVTVQRGNTDAFAPTDDSVFASIQRGYDPAPLVPVADSYIVPEAVDFLATGNFTGDSHKDVLVAARQGGLYLLPGNGDGTLGFAQPINLPGQLSALTSGDFSLADGMTDAAVSITGPDGPELVIFQGVAGKLAEIARFRLGAEGTAVQFGYLDGDPFSDIAVAAGYEVEIIHGWGRDQAGALDSHRERISLPYKAQGLALGDFIWDRDHRTEIAAMAEDGSLTLWERGSLDTRPFTQQELPARRAMRGKVVKQVDAQLETAQSWPRSGSDAWSSARSIDGVISTQGALAPQGQLLTSKISWHETDELLVLDASQNKLNVVEQVGVTKSAQVVDSVPAGSDVSVVRLDVLGTPVAVLPLGKKVNAVQDLMILTAGNPSAAFIPLAPTAIFPVTKLTDTNDGACNADCSLREAVVAANASPGSSITFNLNGTFQLTIDGAAEVGFCGSPSTGDLDISGNNTTITGNGQANTIIQQTRPNDRVMCVDQNLVGGFTFNISGVTMTGGRETFNVGGGNFVSGAQNNSTTLTNVTLSNGQSTGVGGPGGGGANNLGGSVTFAGCTIGGTNPPGASQLNTTFANSAQSSGGGASYSPGDPLGRTPSAGTFTINGTSTLQNNTTASAAAGGGGTDLFSHNLGTGSFSIGGTTTFTSNIATAGNGGGIIVEALQLTLSGTAMNTNSAPAATHRGGAVFMSGGGLTFGSNTSFSGNTAAVTTGSCISTNGAVTVTGTGNNINDNVEILGAGIWTNNAGTSVTFLNLNIIEGTFNANNSTTNVTNNLNLLDNSGGDACLFNGNTSTMTVANLSIGEGTFNATSGTTNVTGNFTFTANTFNANGGTFDFNGSGAQSINGPGSPTFSTLTVNKTGGSTLTLNVNAAISSTLTVGSGVFDLLGFTANRTAAGGTLTVSNGATLKVGGANSLPTNFTTYSLGPTSTVEYEGASGQTINAVNYGHLTSSGAGARTLVNGSTTGIAGIFTPGTNTYTVTGSTVDFNGSVAQTVPAFNFNNLTISNTHGANAVTLVNGGTIGIAGTFTPGTSTFTMTGNIVNFNGTGAQAVPAFNFNSLTISGARTINTSVTLVNGGTIGVAGTFSPTATFSGTGAFIVTGNTVNFNGAGAQTIPAFNFNDLNVSNTHGANAVTLINGGTIGVAGTFTPGTNTFTITGNTVNFNGVGAQTIPAFNYNNLTISGARTGANNVTLANGGTIGIAGAFSPTATFGTGNYVITNNTIDFNGTGAQTIPALGTVGYNNLTISGARTTNSVTLVNGGTIAIAGVFSPTATFTSGNYVTTNNTVNFNSTGAQTIPALGATGSYNNLTISGARSGANNVTLANGGTIGITGTFSPTATFGTGNYVITNNTIDFNGTGAQTIPALGTVGYNNLTISNARTTNSVTLVNGGTIAIAGVFSPTATFTSGNYVTTNNTVDFNSTGAQTIPQLGPGSYNNLTISGARTTNNVTLANGGTIRIRGVFNPSATFTSGAFVVTGNTVEYNGSSAQTLPSAFTTYNNLTLNNAAGTTGFAGLIVNGLLRVQLGTFTSASTFKDVQIDSGATLAGTNATTMNVTGSWTNNGGAATSFTANGNTVNFNGSTPQTISGTTFTFFNNLTIANTSGGVSLGQSLTVNGLLTLTSDLTTGANIVTMPAAATSGPALNAADVVGNVKRIFVSAGSALSFGNPFNTIQINSGAVPADITVNLVKSAPVGFASAVQRTYTITPNGANGPATLRLHYLDSELNGNSPETSLNLRRFNGTGWQPFVATSSNTGDALNNWLENNAVSTFSPWTFSTFTPTASNGVIRGRITTSDGTGVEGAVVRLSGTQNRKFITDATGFYRFDNVETDGFYTVTPSRVNYGFNPSTRSFSQLGQTTEATFGATLASSGFVSPLDTPEYFVRQHYLDFLAREPDESGFNFWSDQVLSCGNDTGCMERRLINVSAAYFLSIEFQETGGLVDGLYRVSYGRRPLYGEFVPDRGILARNVIVGRSGWEQLLESNKQSFITAFVQRPSFITAYGNLTNDNYVDELIRHTGVSFSAAERDALVNGLTNGTTTRAGVLRQIAENQRFAAAKFNEAFVMMEYFGYLLRDPDDDGYQFWLRKLNQFNGNFEQAEMIKAFIVSGEFRDRFPR